MTAAMPPSTFLNPGAAATVDSLAILQLQRDTLVPVVLKSQTTVTSDDYAEGHVQNTRFGSFPHSTLVSQAWGSQILASKVDTGSRGRAKKRKHAELSKDDASASTSSAVVAATAAGTGFAHLLPPTPEAWTISLPHRTQVVYTPDYSYILQRMRVFPGSVLIEAGAGSGSFTHASARAVFSGTRRRKQGHVFSYEYHEPRVQSLRAEIESHRLADTVTVTHRDVYNGGFALDAGGSPRATAIFLDLPAPWMALRHLTRKRLSAGMLRALETPMQSVPAHVAQTDEDVEWTSPLDPAHPTTVCTFTPCIEQAQCCVAALRTLGWVDVEMVEVANRRYDIRRERTGLAEEGLRGVNAGPKDVEEAMGRLIEVGRGTQEWEQTVKERSVDGGVAKAEKGAQGKGVKTAKQVRQERNREEEKGRKTFKEGRLVSRSEAEVKGHTSYLCFAVLPVEWTDEDEEKARKRWGGGKVQTKTAADGANGTAGHVGDGKVGDGANGTASTSDQTAMVE